MNFKSNKRKCTTLNYRKYFSLVLVLCLWGISPQLIAQGGTKIVKGIVVDELNEPMIGVNVMEKGTSNGTITDFNGKFQLKVSPNGSSLVVTYIGYAKKEVAVGNADVKIQLAPDTKQIEEIVVVGYAQQTKKSVVGAIAQTSGEALKSKGAVSNLTDALNGSIPGVTVLSRSGAPGSSGQHSAAPEILIRGLSTWNNSQPLILVDGVERAMSDINIDEIENFSVLKDASATAVFGVKGANGVILITSKRGQLGKAKVSAEVNVSMKTLSKVEKPLGSYESLLARNYAILNEIPLSNESLMSYFIPTRVLGYYRDGIEPEKYTNIDWQDVMLRDQTFSSKYNVNVTGGTEFVKYFTSLAYLKDGDILNTKGGNRRGYDAEFKYERVNFRTNLDFTLTKSTTLKVNLSGYYGRQQDPNEFAQSFWSGLYKYSPNTPLPVYSDGTYGMDDPMMSPQLGKNYLYSLQTAGISVDKRTALTSDFDLEQKLDFITKGLSVKGRFSFDNYFSTKGGNTLDPSDYVRKRYDFNSNKWIYDVPSSGSDGLDFQMPPLTYTTESVDSKGTQRSMYYELALNYRRSFGKHNVGALANFNRSETAKGSSWPSKREDWVGRVTYDYDGKYLVEVNGAYNGSEFFGPDYKFAFFPSIAVGWRISEEPFIKNNIPQISNLKLRYSIGLIGSDNVGGQRWGYMTSWDPAPIGIIGSNPGDGGIVERTNATFGDQAGRFSIYNGQSYKEGVPGNTTLQWEMARKQNYGVEFGFFNDMISGSVDYFNDYRYKMLMSSTQRKDNYPSFVGLGASSANAGEVKIHGLEVELKAKKKFGNVNLWGSYTWTLAKNEIIFAEDGMLTPAYQKKQGFRIGQTTTTIATEVIDSWDKMYTGVLSENNSVRSQTLLGSFRVIDFNSDGFISEAPDANTASKDAAPWGFIRQPQNTYSFSIGADIKGFSAMVQFYGIYNTTVSGAMMNKEFEEKFPTVYAYNTSRTTTPEYGVENPSFRAFGIDYRSGLAQYGRIDGSMLRLKTLQVSYSFPKKLLKSLTFENLRFFVNGNNLIMWSQLPIDMEGSDLSISSTYPNTRNINFGMNVTF